jgi:lipopolysaccharide heptosyltransferase II
LQDFPVDRAALSARNQSMADAFHRLSVKHRIREQLMHAAAQVPVPHARPTRERILVKRPDHLGDVLLITPALAVLRARYPDAIIDVLVGPWAADVLAHNQDIDHVLTLPFPGFSRGGAGKVYDPYVLAVNAARRLRRVGYSRAFILRPDHWWGAAVAKWAGIPVRVGYAHAQTAPFLTHAAPLHDIHAAAQNVWLAGEDFSQLRPARPESAPLRLTVTQDAADWVNGYLGEFGIGASRPIIVIHPGSGAAVKLWNDADWATTAGILAEEIDACIVLTGSDSESPLTHRIISTLSERKGVQWLDMTGETTLDTLAALYQRARLVMGPDSGPLHVAAAVGTPSVVLYGPASMIEFGPWGPGSRHIGLRSTMMACIPCRVLNWEGDNLSNHPCVRDIHVSAVLDAARRALRA